LLSKNS